MLRNMISMAKIVVYGMLGGFTVAAAVFGLQTLGDDAVIFTLVGGNLGALAAALVHGRQESRRRVSSAQARSWHEDTPEVQECSGWKTASVHDIDGQIIFRGVYLGEYQAESVAVCERGCDHLAPQADCTCGFHIYRDRDRARRKERQNCNDALLEVELYGTIVEHERGARGAEQSVLAVHVRPRCRLCTRRAIGMTSAPGPGSSDSRLVASCVRCAQKGSLLTLAELAARSGTEFLWDRVPRFPERVKEILAP